MGTAGVIYMEGTVRESELIGKVHSAVHHQCQQWGYAAPADVLVDIGVLPKQKYEDWRFGKVRYLEAVCTCNLKKLSFIMKQIRSYAKKSNLKPSFCYYKRWGVKKKHGLFRILWVEANNVVMGFDFIIGKAAVCSYFCHTGT